MRATMPVTTWVLGLLAVVSAAACGGSKDKADSGTTGGLVCVGTPVACGLLSASQCASAAGCAPGACSGTASSCASFASSTECLLQQGCTPGGGGSGACAGVALACLALSGDTECRAQQGCSWQEGCSGRAASCQSLNAAACLAQPGCRVESGSPSDGGTAPDSSTPVPRDCEDAGVPSQIVIDDMEDQTPSILGSVAYGAWYVYNDETVGGHMTPDAHAPFMMEPIPGGRCASEYAMRMSGTGFSQWGAGMGFDFGYGDSTASGRVVKLPVDAHRFSGIRFWARVGQATTMRAGFSVSAGSCLPPDGGTDPGDGGDAGGADAGPTRVPSDCAQTFAHSLVLTPEWTRYDIPFDELLSSTDRLLPIPRDQIYSFQFLVAASVTFDLWIDDISWIPAAPAP